MERLTKLEIQRALLGGESISWRNSAGKSETIQLKKPEQRRLFDYLLGSQIREPKGLSDSFIEELAAAYSEKGDPAEEGFAAESTSTLPGPWRLQTIESEGFGGINTYSGPLFSLPLDTESLLLQGPNGSGKSSLVGAVLWAMTGDRPRDHSQARPEERAEVFDAENRAIGTWPPVACYPNDRKDLSASPHVRVTLTFVDPNGNVARVERELRDGKLTHAKDASLNAPDILVETGLLMPSRMSLIRFEKGPSALTAAVQRLTGLDDLIDIGLLADGLCHKGREYLATNAKELERYGSSFDAALDEARRCLGPSGETIESFKPLDTEDNEGALAATGKRLRERAAELTRVVAEDIVHGLDLTNGKVQQEVAGAISGALEDVELGLSGLPTWKRLTELANAFSDEKIVVLEQAIETAQTDFVEALNLAERGKCDTRLQLKALGARWHEAHRRQKEVNDCPLCDQPLTDPAMAAELESLRHCAEAVTRRLEDNLNAC